MGRRHKREVNNVNRKVSTIERRRKVDDYWTGEINERWKKTKKRYPKSNNKQKGCQAVKGKSMQKRDGTMDEIRQRER